MERNNRMLRAVGCGMVGALLVGLFGQTSVPDKESISWGPSVTQIVAIASPDGRGVRMWRVSSGHDGISEFRTGTTYLGEVREGTVTQVNVSRFNDQAHEWQVETTVCLPKRKAVKEGE